MNVHRMCIANVHVKEGNNKDGFCSNWTMGLSDISPSHHRFTCRHAWHHTSTTFKVFEQQSDRIRQHKRATVDLWPNTIYVYTFLYIVTTSSNTNRAEQSKATTTTNSHRRTLNFETLVMPDRQAEQDQNVAPRNTVAALHTNTHTDRP